MFEPHLSNRTLSRAYSVPKLNVIAVGMKIALVSEHQGLESISVPQGPKDMHASHRKVCLQTGQLNRSLI